MAGPNIQYVRNNMPRMRAFADSLPRERMESRFLLTGPSNTPDDWHPAEAILIHEDGKPVAVVDACRHEPGLAELSLFAAYGKGAYARDAIADLKKTIGPTTWMATVLHPENARLMAILIDNVDLIYDQFVDNFSQRMLQYGGKNDAFLPINIAASTSFLANYGLHRDELSDAATQAQILYVAARNDLQNPEARLIAPNGTLISPQDVVTLAFEALELPMLDRQMASRALLFDINQVLGVISPNWEAVEAMDGTGRHNEYNAALKRSAPTQRPENGPFDIQAT